MTNLCSTSTMVISNIHSRLRWLDLSAEAATWKSSQTHWIDQYRPRIRQSACLLLQLRSIRRQEEWHHTCKWNSKRSWRKRCFNVCLSRSTILLITHQLHQKNREIASRIQSLSLHLNWHLRLTKAWLSVDRPRCLSMSTSEVYQTAL